MNLCKNGIKKSSDLEIKKFRYLGLITEAEYKAEIKARRDAIKKRLDDQRTGVP